MSTFGKSADWFEASAEELLPLVEEKRQALSSYKNLPSERNLQALRTTSSRAQQTARRCVNDYWLRLCFSIQTAATVGNIRGMYEGIKQATGTTQNRTAPLKSATGEIIKDRDQQMNCWVEHYSELYSRENVVSVEALDAIECLPILEEFDLEPTVEAVEKAVASLSSGKASGDDGISPEVLKCARGIPKTEFHELLCQCWRWGSVPQDMRDHQHQQWS
ncbi:uncharacterized protein [Procambarus clarkii]|uniref:uncharacterized protein n=1 Tax=Procambarus clarkii TaxID=6728 RepID=UPI003741FD1E